LGEEFDLLVQQVRSHFESIQLGQHQLPHLIASRFFLAFTNNDVSQQFVFSRKLGWILAICPGQLGGLKFCTRVFQLNIKLRGSGCQIMISIFGFS